MEAPLLRVKLFFDFFVILFKDGVNWLLHLLYVEFKKDIGLDELTN
jgi:hypothetical protein